MELILFVIVFSLINLGFLNLIKRVEKRWKCYDITFCRDVRAELGMITCPSEVEAKREKLNNKKSKF